MDNMMIFSQLATTPQEARKPISAGRLKGFTDINPMWRIKRLTEVFGPFGIGWYYITRKREFVPGANGEVACFVDIDLFYKQEDQWSQAVPGTGGSMFIAKERNGPYTSDEAIKMATTDAIGSACKLLGMSSDIYFEKDRTKYTTTSDAGQPKQEPPQQPPKHICTKCGKPITGVRFKGGGEYTEDQVLKMSADHFHCDMCYQCMLAESGVGK